AGHSATAAAPDDVGCSPAFSGQSTPAPPPPPPHRASGAASAASASASASAAADAQRGVGAVVAPPPKDGHVVPRLGARLPVVCLSRHHLAARLPPGARPRHDGSDPEAGRTGGRHVPPARGPAGVGLLPHARPAAQAAAQGRARPATARVAPVTRRLLLEGLGLGALRLCACAQGRRGGGPSGEGARPLYRLHDQHGAWVRLHVAARNLARRREARCRAAAAPLPLRRRPGPVEHVALPLQRDHDRAALRPAAPARQLAAHLDQATGPGEPSWLRHRHPRPDRRRTVELRPAPLPARRAAARRLARVLPRHLGPDRTAAARTEWLHEVPSPAAASRPPQQTGFCASAIRPFH
ncbi:hypothetical protein EMIHUDRAFT_432198, partial [Emiliania huxleyi CCMP1516]|uniref:Uncharacterized protein n=2 Tax=Emiliania huxleyi TaxID=2903 RepID=A0A0D3JI27_EMIH1